MARMAGLVVPGLPHHVTQRGVRSINIFDDDDAGRLYLELMCEHGERTGLRFLAWRLNANHVHLIVVPGEENSLARGIGDAHKSYTRARNFSEGVRGMTRSWPTATGISWGWWMSGRRCSGMV